MAPVRNPITVIEALKRVMMHPAAKDFRVAQAISNAVQISFPEFDGDIYYVEDVKLIEALDKYVSILNK